MKRILLVAFFMLLPACAFAQDKASPVTFELDEEKLTIEADIPSVDLILSFKELQERDNSMKESFLEEIVNSAKDEPF